MLWRAEEGDSHMAMTLQERTLYHQIHPLKLATDIGVTAPAIALFWAHQFWAALLVTLLPSVIVSAALLRWGRLEWLRDSAFGRYLARYMTPAAQFARSLALILLCVGGWLRLWWVIALGLLIVLVAWGYGLALQRRTSMLQ